MLYLFKPNLLYKLINLFTLSAYLSINFKQNKRVNKKSFNHSKSQIQFEPNFIFFHPLMKFLKLVCSLSLCPSTFLDDEHYQSASSIHRMSHLVYHGICNHPSTSNTNLNRILWTVSLSTSMECPVGFHRILPSKREYHHRDLLRKVTRWKASL